MSAAQSPFTERLTITTHAKSRILLYLLDSALRLIGRGALQMQKRVCPSLSFQGFKASAKPQFQAISSTSGKLD